MPSGNTFPVMTWTVLCKEDNFYEVNPMKKTSWYKSTTLAAALCLTLGGGIAAPATVHAWDAGSALLATVQLGAQYAALNKQINHLDNEGRDEFMAELKSKEGVNHDPRANAMLDDIMTRLQASVATIDPSIKKKPYNYFVNNNKTFNAFCTLGHNISVNIGAFTEMNYNEDELAFIIAHEMAHGQKKHPASGVKRAIPLNLLAALYSSQNPNTVSVLGSVVLANVGTAKLVTKPMEKQADALAFDYAVGAGFNVGGGAAVWQRILDKHDSGRGSFFAELFNDHPTSISRRDVYSKDITAWSNNTVKVNPKTGTVYIRNKEFYTPVKNAEMSGQEQAYLIAGNLSAVFHVKGKEPGSVWTSGANVLMVGNQPIMSLSGVSNPGEVTARLRTLLAGSGTATVEKSAGDKAAKKADVKKADRKDSKKKAVRSEKKSRSIEKKAEADKKMAAAGEKKSMKEILAEYKAAKAAE